MFTAERIMIACCDCSGKEMSQYYISTRYQLKDETDGPSLRALEKLGVHAAFFLELTYQSDIPFEIEIFLLDNFERRVFQMKKGNQYAEDELFIVQLPSSDEQLSTYRMEIQLENITASDHDFIFVIHNKTKARNRSVRAYDFCRLFANDLGQAASFQFSEEQRAEFVEMEQTDTIFELQPSLREEQGVLLCELQFDVEKKYEGERLHPPYLDNIEKTHRFVTMVLQGDKIMPVNGLPFVWCETALGKKGKIVFRMDPTISYDRELVFLTISYPCSNPNEMERYQLMAYNTVSYYQLEADRSGKAFWRSVQKNETSN